MFDPQRFEQARAQVIQRGLAGDFPHDGRKHMRPWAVIFEVRARLEGHRLGEERFHPSRFIGELRLILVSATHGEQIAYAHHFQVGRRLRGRVFREIFQDQIVHTHLAFRDRQSDRGRSEALAERVQDVGLIGGLRFPPTVGDDLPMPQQHETMHRILFLIRFLDIGANGRRGNALRLGRAAGQRIRGQRESRERAQRDEE
jgi:hypothetical protein